MARIEVWSGGLRNRFQKVGSGLYLTTCEGKAVAGLNELFLRWPHYPHFVTIPASDELAAEVLGAKRMPCPYCGKEPDSHGDYKISPFGIDGDMAEVVCYLCGYHEFYNGSPHLRIALGVPGHGISHPQKTYLASERKYDILRQATWTDGRLDTISDRKQDGVLIFCQVSTWRSRKTVHAAMMKQFPAAEIVHEQFGCFVLRQQTES